MSQKILCNYKLKIEEISGIKKIFISICNNEIPKKIKKIKCNIFSKDRTINYYKKPINKKLTKLKNINTNIKLYSPSILNVATAVLNLSFGINKKDYIFRKEFIYENIDDLYRRIPNLHNLVKKKIKDKYEIKSHEDTFKFNEKIFNLIITDLELNYNSYDELNDKVIVSSILKFLQDKI